MANGWPFGPAIHVRLISVSNPKAPDVWSEARNSVSEEAR